MNTVFIQGGRILAIDDRVIDDLQREELIELLHDVVDQVIALQAMVQRGEFKTHELN